MTLAPHASNIRKSSNEEKRMMESANSRWSGFEAHSIGIFLFQTNSLFNPFNPTWGVPTEINRIDHEQLFDILNYTMEILF